MNKTLLGALAVGVTLGAIGVATLDIDSADAAPRVKQHAYDDQAIRITHGSFVVHGPGQIEFTACGAVSKADGGTVPVETQCVTCVGGFNATTRDACIAAWKAANEL